MDYRLSNNESILKDFGERLKQVRINANLTQKELAERSGLTKQSISNLERGAQNISFNGLIELLRVLGLVENLQLLLPEVPIVSPIELMKLEKARKKRASKK